MADVFTSSTPVPAFNFKLIVEGFYDIPIKSVKAFTKNNAYEHISQGGLNDYVIMKRKQVTEPFTFQVERYAPNSLTDPLANGAEFTLPIFLQVLKKQNSSLLDNDTARVYMFTGCVITGKEYGELNSERPGILTEVITFAYREMYVIPNLFSLGGV